LNSLEAVIHKNKRARTLFQTRQESKSKVFQGLVNAVHSVAGTEKLQTHDTKRFTIADKK